MLTANNITYKAGTNTLVDDISIDFKPGIVNLILGSNGAGKSTFIKVLSGQLPASSGTVMYGGKSLKNYTLKEMAQNRAVLSQNMDIAFSIKVWEVVLMGRHPHFAGKPSAKDWQICAEVIAYLNIETFKDRDYTTLSGGEKQRVQFARVLAQIWHDDHSKCKYLLLDEPLNYLDVYYQHQLMQQIKALCTETLVVVAVIHDLNIAAKYGDNILFLQGGKMLLTGNREAIFTAANIKSAYGVDTEIFTNNDTQYVHF